jgi:hypothetical protein
MASTANKGDTVTRKKIAYTVLVLAIGIAIALYTSDVSSSEGMPETISLGSLAKVYGPVAFSHEMHSAMAEDCGDCHHYGGAGETPSCGKCHPATLASKESGPPGLKDAYHGQCIACHKEMEMGPTGCMDCHTKRKSETPAVKQASKDAPVKQKSEKLPETFTLSSLENMYQPVVFTHAMHAQMAEECVSCHHHSQAGQTPACDECHGEPFNPENLNMPGLKGAYHLQCMTCHRDVGAPVGCTECHAKKAKPGSKKAD